MSRRWFHTRDGTPHGPFTEEEVKGLIARGVLLPDDWVWPEGGQRQEGSIASAEFAYSNEPTPAPQGESPAWLEDLRHWVELDVYAASKRGPTPPPAIVIMPPAPTRGLPDWLEDWQTAEIPKKKPVAPPVQPPIVCPVVSEPAQVVALSAAETMRQESGFDPDTGQIFDPAKFRKWQQQQARAASTEQAPVSNASIFEVFRRGRVAIDVWIDDENNSLRIKSEGIGEIKKNPAIQGILAEYVNYGADLQEKLRRHLEFTIENRKKYLTASQGRTK